jgi:glutathione S-transferase
MALETQDQAQGATKWCSWIWITTRCRWLTGQTEMLELFHAINSVCAQKVRIQLAEKQLDWKSRLMTLEGDQFTPEYLKLNPNGVVPTLLHDGVLVVESTVILFYLEDCFPAVRLMPHAPRDKAAVRMYTKLIDEYVHNACTIVTFATAMRSRFQAMDAEDRERYLSSAPDQKRAEYKRDVIASGLESRFFGEALSHFMKLLTWISKSTADHTYLAGGVYSLADVAVLPYVVRLDHCAFHRCGRTCRTFSAGTIT